MLIEQLVLQCAKHKLDLEQLMVLALVHGRKTQTIVLYANTFPTKSGSFLTAEQKEDLINRKFLVKTDKGYIVGEAYYDIFMDKDILGEELWSAYPGFVKDSNGRTIPLTTMDITSIGHIYWNMIAGLRSEHLEILKDIEFAIENNLITFGIKKFLESKYWVKIRELRLNTAPNVVLPSTHSKDDF